MSRPEVASRAVRQLASTPLGDAAAWLWEGWRYGFLLVGRSCASLNEWLRLPFAASSPVRADVGHLAASLNEGPNQCTAGTDVTLTASIMLRLALANGLGRPRPSQPYCRDVP